MKTLNSNGFLVLTSVRNKENDTGLNASRGTEKETIIKNSGLSSSTVNRALKILLEQGLIAEAIKQVNKKAYYITEDGIKRLKEVKGRI